MRDLEREREDRVVRDALKAIFACKAESVRGSEMAGKWEAERIASEKHISRTGKLVAKAERLAEEGK